MGKPSTHLSRGLAGAGLRGACSTEAHGVMTMVQGDPHSMHLEEIWLAWRLLRAVVFLSSAICAWMLLMAAVITSAFSACCGMLAAFLPAAASSESCRTFHMCLAA